MNSLYTDHARRLRGLPPPPAAVSPAPAVLPGAGGAPIPVPAGTVALSEAGQPLGSTGGLVPEQRTEADARLAALDAAAREAMTLANPAPMPATASTPAAPGRLPPGTSSLAMSQLLGVNPALPGAAGRRSPGADTGVPVLNNAMALETLGATLTASREARLLEAAGAGLPSEADTPEIQQRKLAYHRQRLVNDALGQENDAPGTPLYMGDRPSPRGINPDLIDRPIRDRAVAQRLAQLGEEALATRDNPRIVTVGTDDQGKPIRRILNPKTGNTERVEPEEKPEALTELGKLQREREAARAAGNTEAVEIYDRAIANTKAGVQERPATVNEFLGDVMLSSQYRRDYNAYRKDYDRIIRSATRRPDPDAKPEPADKFKPGNVYKDAAGNRAKYLGNNKWEPL